ncbi:MAG: hypothetical protein KF748_01140 [Xanthobacteraceae bacterium]|nr:hypothetical protein [Xanthobacteraceae bacterium]MBX3547737.1 hypothetical protein [Xanthobacteraceae bacterium]
MHPPNEKAAPYASVRGLLDDDQSLGTKIDDRESKLSSDLAQPACANCSRVFTTRKGGKPKKFCSRECRRAFHDSSEQRAQRAATCEAVKTSNLSKRTPKPENAASEFDWGDAAEDTVQHSFRRIAVYVNPDGDIVFRGEREWDEDDDIWLVISREHLPRLLRHLEGFL